MKKLSVYFLLLFSALYFFSSCGEDSPGGEFTDDGYGYDFTQVLKVYTDDVILPTYADMKNRHGHSMMRYKHLVAVQEEHKQT